MTEIKELKVYKNPFGLLIEEITTMTEEEHEISNQYWARRIFEISGKAKPIKCMYPIKILKVRESIFDPLLTFII